MKTIFCTMIIALLPMTAMAGQIKFDEGVTPQVGSLFYDGAGGALIGSNINFTSALGIGTALNNGSTLDCVNCSLNFTTGLNTFEGPAMWQWASGGVFSIVGDLFNGAINVASGALVAGSFNLTPSLIGDGSDGLLVSVGNVFAHDGLDGHFGFDLLSGYKYAHTALSIQGCITGVNAGFTCALDNADLNLTAVPVPSPAPVFMMGIGLLAMRSVIKKRQA